MSTCIEFDNVVAGYKDFMILNNLSFKAETGTVTLLIGPNGAGKSTVLKTLFGLLKPRQGRILLDGQEIAGTSPRDLLAKGIAFVPQGRNLFGQLSVLENLELGGITADALIQKFHIAHVADKPAGELSYGQQKLVDIAMAFMSDPKLILLDEPCAGVNPKLVKDIGDLLRDLNKERGSTFVVIEHNMDFIMSLCHRVMVMVEGEVLAIGTPDEIRNNKQVLDAYLGS